jgi:hypothetical protein
MRLKNDIHASTYIRGYPMLTLYIADVERDVGMKKLSQEEAAKVLEGMKVKIEIPKAAVTQWKRNTALDMAIEALKHSEVPNSSDCISRQTVIDEYGDWYVEEGTAEGFIGTVKQLLEGLSPAQPEPIRINLNEPIKVKLTDWGKEIYYHQYDRTNQIAGREICKPKLPKEDENGYTEFQLWCFMELYGECMGMTLPNVIKPLEIVYER